MLYPNSTGLPQKNQRMNIAPRWIPLPPRALDAHGGLVGAHGAAPLGKLMFNAKLIIFNPKFIIVNPNSEAHRQSAVVCAC